MRRSRVHSSSATLSSTYFSYTLVAFADRLKSANSFSRASAFCFASKSYFFKPPIIDLLYPGRSYCSLPTSFSSVLTLVFNFKFSVVNFYNSSFNSMLFSYKTSLSYGMRLGLNLFSSLWDRYLCELLFEAGRANMWRYPVVWGRFFKSSNIYIFKLLSIHYSFNMHVVLRNWSCFRSSSVPLLFHLF